MAFLDAMGRLGARLVLLATAVLAAQAQAATYGIQSLNTPLADFVETGDSVRINVTAPSTSAVIRAALVLNGRNVMSALQPDGSPGSLTGTVAGLQTGVNVFQLFSTKTSRVPVAELRVVRATTPALACAALASLSGFPVQASGTTGGTTITLAQLNPATGGANPLPEHCQIQGMLQDRLGVSGVAGTPSFNSAQPYGTRFEVRLPTKWNGRYMLQGGGGTEGNLPAATGSQTGTASVPMLRQGWAVASQNGGHTNSQLPATTPATATTPSILQQNMFFPDAQAVKDWAYNSIDVTTQTAKFLIDAYYGREPDRSYFVGCSTSGRQGMAMSQLFPGYYDGIVAGDPFFVPPDISLSETWSLERIIEISPKDANGNTLYHLSIPVPDQNLFTTAIMAACDALDGLVDGVIDNLAACNFDPATFVFPSTGPYGAIAPGEPLQCTGAKTPTCLTPAQVNATKKIAEGPRTSNGDLITSPDGTVLVGYPFDGGFMQPQGIPTRDIGTATQLPGNIGLGSGQLPLFWFKTPDPSYNPLTVNYDTDMPLVAATSPAINHSTDIAAFVNRGGKLIFYHGLSDSGPPWPYTLKYFNDVASLHGGLAGAANFMKLYLIPSMGHCGGNAATSRFDMLAPLVKWVESGVAPNDIVASGTSFFTTAGTLTGLPATRSRPLCAYPKTLRYTGPAGGDISIASNYTCQ